VDTDGMTNSELDKFLGDAVMSDCNLYRYALMRSWDSSKPCIAFIGLNPSTADASLNDPTIRKCIRYAMAWGFGSLVMLNAFAFRATDPTDMRRARDPIGPLNDLYLDTFLADVTMIVACWGDYGFDRGAELARRYAGMLFALRVNFSGHPAHPLYLRADLQPQPYTATPWIGQSHARV
jgi:hypothetical protein